MKAENERLSDGAEWMARLAEGDLTPAERRVLADWLRESPTHVRELLEHTMLQRDLAALAVSDGQIDAWVQEARSAGSAPVALRSGDAMHGPVLPGARTPRRTSGWFAIAASVALAAIAVSTYIGWQDGRYTTQFGEQRILTFKDGSVITLNTESAIKVDFSSARREIALLKGEAFFRVAHDATRPFEVNARGATVKALGTQFNVRIAPRDTVVSVVDGAVEVRREPPPHGEAPDAEQTSAMRLQKGEEARIDLQQRRKTSGAARAAIEKIDTVAALRAAAWTRGRLEFEAEPLAEVLSEFKRYRELDVRIENPAIGELKLTGAFDSHDPESALAYIGTIPGLAVDRTESGAFVIRYR